MDVDSLTRVKRSSVDVAFYGDKSSGKTLLMTILAFDEWCKGRYVYANYDIFFDERFTKIGSLDDLWKVDDGLLIGDDFENWCSSKYQSKQDKKDVIEITTDLGKRNVDFLYSCKDLFEIEKAARRTLDSICRVKRVIKYQPGNIEELEFMKNYLDYQKLVVEVFDKISLRRERILEYDDLEVYCELYDTKEEIEKLV